MEQKEEQDQPFTSDDIYALIWRSTKPDEEFDENEFNDRVPRLMDWLRALYTSGHLVACGGGGFATHSGGLTLIRASSPDEAARLSAGSPMNEIGTTDILFWGVFYADLNVKERENRLAEPPSA